MLDVYRDFLKIAGLCTIWFTSSSGQNIINKNIFKIFPYPLTVTTVHILSLAIYLGPFLKCCLMKKSISSSSSRLSTRVYFTMILPLAFGKFLASVSSHLSVLKMSVSYAHTVKALMPVFTVILSRIVLHEKQSTQVLLSLLPIICGVLVATATEISFDMVGMFSALLATLTFAVQNIFTKKVLKETGVHHLRLLLILGQLAAIGVLPIWYIVDVRRIVQDTLLWDKINSIPWMVILMLFSGFLNAIQNMCAFSVISMVSPLSYAVANSSKRIIVITSSLFMLQNPVSFNNVLGMLTAIGGVFLYNKAKLDQNRKKRLLPLDSSADPHHRPENATFAGAKNDLLSPNMNGFSQSNFRVV